jgi:hypothetical protein
MIFCLLNVGVGAFHYNTVVCPVKVFIMHYQPLRRVADHDILGAVCLLSIFPSGDLRGTPEEAFDTRLYI